MKKYRGTLTGEECQGLQDLVVSGEAATPSWARPAAQISRPGCRSVRPLARGCRTALGQSVSAPFDNAPHVQRSRSSSI
jgi:hypothetical protein